MKKKFLTLSLLAACTLGLHAEVKLQKQGTATQIVVGGRPMLVLGGELSNSAATSPADIDRVIPRMKQLGLNTVFCPAYWDLIEAEEGRYDFTLVDRVIDRARENGLKIVFLWFGAWKNSMSCYAPLWFKQDTKKYPRSLTATGKPLEIATCFSDKVLQADRRAFCRLMQHIKDKDSRENTVIMVQVENEIGMLESARDHSPLAEKAYREQVPAALLRALKSDRRGTWSQVFGTDRYADEKFQAYHYARYVEQLASAGKAVYDLPMYVNAAMNSRGRRPGEYPSAGPLAHLLDIWHFAAPSIDVFAPDIYDTGFKDWVARYKTPTNPFLTPETRLGEYSGVRALYTFGAVDAMGFSPFAIDQGGEEATRNVSQAYGLLQQLSPLLLPRQGKGQSWGVLFTQDDRERQIEDDGLVITCRHYFTLPWDPRATDGSAWPEGGAIILKLAKYEYLVAGSGIVTVFQTATEKKQAEEKTLGEDGFAEAGKDTGKSAAPKFRGKRIGLGYVDQVTVDSTGHLQFVRRDNGDQDHQGRHARISCGEYKILHVKLYEY